MTHESIELQSVSLLLDEPALFKGPSIASLLPVNPLPYKMMELAKNQEIWSPYLEFMPEVFHRRLNAHSKPEFIIVNQIYRLVELLRYNFSNGIQVSTNEILRHPLHRYVPQEFLPQLKSDSLNFQQYPITLWALTQDKISSQVNTIQDIIQLLIHRVITANSQNRLPIFLQTHSQTSKSLKVSGIEFVPGNELDWRVDFDDRKELKTGFKLISNKRQNFYFFNSYAIDPANARLIIHPWQTEFNLLQEKFSTISMQLSLTTNAGMPAFEVVGESRTKEILKHLRSRLLPVKITGDTVSLSSQQSQTGIHFNEDGRFTISHGARVPGQKDISRKGWCERSFFYFKALSHGLPYAMQSDARDMASTNEFKRNWDLALLKHLGILQFLFLESLSLHFQGCLTDGVRVLPEHILLALNEKIKNLLTWNQPKMITANIQDLCSKSVLACFEKFVAQIFYDLDQGDSFYSESGEILMNGLFERESRIIYELLLRMANSTSGTVFKKSRTPFLTRTSTSFNESESTVADSDFFFPESSLYSSLEIVQRLIPFGFKIYLKNTPIQELSEKDLTVKFGLRSKLDQSDINWFELSPQFFLMGRVVDPDQFLLLGKGGVIEFENNLFLVHQSQMPSLKLLEQFWKNLQKGKVESTTTKKKEKVYQLPRNQTLTLLALRNAGILFQGDSNWDHLCEFYENLGRINPQLELPGSIAEQLKPYQKQGVQWLFDLYRLRLGALLADDMGLGKTIQTLGFLEFLRNQDEMGAVLIVLPSSLVHNWRSEIAKFTPAIPVIVFSEEPREKLNNAFNKKSHALVIVTYGLLVEHSESLSRYPWNIVVFDEAQNIKNINAKRTTAARALNARFKIALSGTPMENNFAEFYSLVDTLIPGSLGPLETFRSQFVNGQTVDYEIIKDLKSKMKPIFLRRSKKEILDQLPEKQETTIRVTFEDQQKEIYRNIALSYNERVLEAMSTQGNSQVQLQMITALLRLRQACSDPRGLPEVQYNKIPPKLDLLVDALKEVIALGESALIFTQFLQTLTHLESLINTAGLPVFVLHGGINNSKRQKILTEFSTQSGGALLLMTLKTGGVGLNLTKASYVFHIEPWWNSAVENQATDRAHRMGQTKSVQVFKYVMHNSLEEKIEILKERKDSRFQSLFTDTESPATQEVTKGYLSKEDFDRLLEL